MALDARTRSSIYAKLQPMLDGHEANALMSEFPASEADELVTRHFLRAELAQLRGEMTARIAAVDSRLTEKMAKQSHMLLTAVGVATAVIVAAGRI